MRSVPFPLYKPRLWLKKSVYLTNEVNPKNKRKKGKRPRNTKKKRGVWNKTTTDWTYVQKRRFGNHTDEQWRDQGDVCIDTEMCFEKPCLNRLQLQTLMMLKILVQDSMDWVKFIWLPSLSNVMWMSIKPK